MLLFRSNPRGSQGFNVITHAPMTLAGKFIVQNPT